MRRLTPGPEKYKRGVGEGPPCPTRTWRIWYKVNTCENNTFKKNIQILESYHVFFLFQETVFDFLTQTQNMHVRPSERERERARVQ